MITSKLMAHLVRYIVNIKGIAHGTGRARDPTRFEHIIAHFTEIGYAATARAHHVTNVVVGGTNDAVYI